MKDGGYIAVSEISWLTATRPDEIEQYWLNEYSEIDTIENKLAVIEKCGYTPIAHFVLGGDCWDNYYQPLLAKAEAFLAKYDYAGHQCRWKKQGINERFKGVAGRKRLSGRSHLY